MFHSSEQRIADETEDAWEHGQSLAGIIPAALDLDATVEQPQLQLSVSPAARLIVAGGIFEWYFDTYWAEQHMRSGRGLAKDVLVVQGCLAVHGGYSQVRRAVQVRDIDAAIQAGEIDFTSGMSAQEINAAQGWHGTPRVQRGERA